MSWLLENWFGSKESLEQVREDIHEHLHKELYLGVSGIENPEQSSTRIPSNELDLVLNGPWDNKLDETESELLQYIHDELPPVVRDEVGILPFFTQVTSEGYLVLAYIRNATDRNVLLQRLPLSLVTPEGEEVAHKTFDLMAHGPIGDLCSRPVEFLFPWNEFSRLPEEEVPLTLAYKKAKSKKRTISDTPDLGLTAEVLERYQKQVADLAPVEEGHVDLQVLDMMKGDEDGIKVVVAFRNGLAKRLEFTEVPIMIHDKSGDSVARVHFSLENMKVDANSSRIWVFEIPASSINKPDVDVAELKAFIPQAKQQKKKASSFTQNVENKGLLQ